VIQQLKEQESPMVRRSKEAVRFKTKQAMAKADELLLSTGENQQ
jgi:hypothetical protein